MPVSISAARINVSQPERVVWRVANNFAWLGLGEGSTRVVRVVANIALARFLGAGGLGVLALAQSSAGYGAYLSDLGVTFYGQAEAARRDELSLPALATEIIPVRAVLGLLSFVAFAVGSWMLLLGLVWRVTFALAGLSILSESLRSDWLFRGRERFDLVTLGRIGECLFLLVWVLVVRARPGAVMLDALGWALAGFVSVGVWLTLLPRLLSGSLHFWLYLQKWFGHLRESFFIAISQFASSAVWLGLMWLVAAVQGKGAVGTITAPYGLVGSAVNLGTLFVLAAYPTSAALYRDSVEAFHQTRRNMALFLLAGGVTTAVIGSLLARPLILLIFGHAYIASIPVLASLVWYIPLRLMRVLYATSLVASSFQRLHPLGALVEAFVALTVAYPAVHAWGATGAAITLLVGESANVCVTLWLVRIVRHGGALSGMGKAPRVELKSAL